MDEKKTEHVVEVRTDDTEAVNTQRLEVFYHNDFKRFGQCLLINIDRDSSIFLPSPVLDSSYLFPGNLSLLLSNFPC